MTEEEYKFEPETPSILKRGKMIPHWVLQMPADPDEAVAAIRFIQKHCDDVSISTFECYGGGYCEIQGIPKEEAP